MNLSILTRFGMAAALVAAMAGSADAAVIYVKHDAAGAANGSSWTNAYRHLTEAIDAAVAGDEIWVATGTYYPDRNTVSPGGTGNRDASFLMKSDVGVYGGFRGTETSRSQRSWTSYPTILSGDIGVIGSHTDNSRTIVMMTGVNSGSILDGFTVSRALADGVDSAFPHQYTGGGVRAAGGSPVIRNCVFTDNWARGGAGIYAEYSTLTVQNSSFLNGWGENRGGGIDLWQCSNILVEDCLFESNTAYFGGGIYGNSGTSGLVDRCTFHNNLSVNGGGVSWAGFSNPVIRNSLFLKNRCDQISFFQQSFNGGAARNWCAGATYVNCVFNGNWAKGAGAAVYDAGPSGSTSVQINCTYVNNNCRDGGVVASASGHVPVLHNAIMWNNVVTPFNGTVTAFTSAIQDGVMPDPLFVNPLGDDGLAGTFDDDLRLQSGSPYINAGNNAALPAGTTTDILGNDRINDGAVDYGAFEFFAQPLCYGDANGDGVVDFNDITTVLVHWLTTGPSGDANFDGSVDFNDITTILGNWLQTCP